MPSLLEIASPETASTFGSLVDRLNGRAPDRSSRRALLDHSSAVDGAGVLATLLDAAEDREVHRRLVDTYDEKEGCIRLRLAEGPGVSVRLHIWTPPPAGRGPYLENVHGHRRYMASVLLAGAYISDDYDYDEDNQELALTGRRVIGAGSSYLIAPETIHAIANPFEQHCVTLIFRGEAVTDRILVFDRTSGVATAYASQRPVADVATVAEQRELSRADYLRWRFDCIRADLQHQSA